MTNPSRESLLESIKPDMKLNRAFFMKIYGYEITTPGFARQALDKLKEVGCSKEYTYYNQFVDEYEEEYRQTMKEAAQWYQNRKDDVKLKKNDNKGVAACQNLQQKSDSELLTLLKKLKESGQL